MLLFMYSYTTQGIAYNIVGKLLGGIGAEAKTANKVIYSSVNMLEFKNSTSGVYVPIIDLDKPNYFSTFNYTIFFSYNSPVVGKLSYLNITFVQDGKELLTLSYNKTGGDAPEKITFTNIQLPVESLNSKVNVNINFLSSFAFLNNKQIDTLIYNQLAKSSSQSSSQNNQQNAGTIVPIQHSKLVDYSRKDESKNITFAGNKETLPPEGDLIIEYPLINDYKKGLSSVIVTDLKNILSNYNVNDDILISIRTIIDNTMMGDYFSYGVITPDIKFDSAGYDGEAFRFKITPVYNITLKIPYIVLNIHYKIKAVNTDSNTMYNSFTITGFEDSVEYHEMSGIIDGSISDLFKSIGLELVLETKEGFNKNIKLNSFDVITKQSISINNEADAFLYYDTNEVRLRLKTNDTLKQVIFNLVGREFESAPNPYITPKIIYKINDEVVNERTLPEVKLSSITYYPSPSSKVKRQVDIIFYDQLQVGEYFIPYALIEDDNIVKAITNDLLKSPYIPTASQSLIKEKLTDAIRSIQKVNYLVDYIKSVQVKFVPLETGKVGLRPVFEFDTQFYGATLKVNVIPLIIKDDTGKVLYADVKGLDVSTTGKVYRVVKSEYDASWSDFKNMNLEIVAQNSKPANLINIKKGKMTQQKTFTVNGYAYKVSHTRDSLYFSYPLQYSSLPRIIVSNIVLLEKYDVRPVVLGPGGSIIYKGDKIELVNRDRYQDKVEVNLYPDLYNYNSDSIKLYINNDVIPLPFNVEEAGYFIVDSTGQVKKYGTSGVSVSGNIINVNVDLVTMLQKELENGNKVYIYVVGSGGSIVYYNEIAVQSILSDEFAQHMELRMLAENKKPNQIKVESSDSAKTLEGYYTARFYIGRDVRQDSIQMNITFNSGGGKADLFKCTLQSCEYELKNDYWAFKNSEYSYADTKIGFDANSGSVVVNILPVAGVIGSMIVDYYTVSISFVDSEGVHHNASFVIEPVIRKFNVEVLVDDLQYMRISPVYIHYSIDFYDLFSKVFMKTADVRKMILNSIVLSVDKELPHSNYVSNIIQFISSGRTLKELVDNEELFKPQVDEGSGALIIYPNLDYEGGENPVYKVNPDNSNEIVLLLPMLADYKLSINGLRVNEYDFKVTPVKNKLIFRLVYSDKVPDLIQGDEVTLLFAVSSDEVISQFFDKLMNEFKASSHQWSEWAKLHIVSMDNTYYDCPIENVTVTTIDNTSVQPNVDYTGLFKWVVEVKAKIPDDIPEGTYSFTFTQSKYTYLYSPLETFDYIHNVKHNSYNTFYIKGGLSINSDLIYTPKSISGRVFYGVNNGVLHGLPSPVKVYNPHTIIPMSNDFQSYTINPTGEFYIIQPYDEMTLNIPVLTSLMNDISELVNYVQITYLVSVNIPDSKNIPPEEYVKSIELLFKNNRVNIDKYIDVQNMKADAKKLFIKIVKGDNTFYYLPISISPYYMTYIPETSNLQVEVKLINGAIIKRNIKLIPVVVTSYWNHLSDTVYVKSVCYVSYVSKPSYEKFVLNKVPVKSVSRNDVIVDNSEECIFDYYNVEIPITTLTKNNIDLSDVSVSQFKQLFSSWSDSFKKQHKQVYSPKLYSLTGGLIFFPQVFETSQTYSPHVDYYSSIIMYMKVDTNLNVMTEVKVAPANYTKVEEWVKKHGVTTSINGVTFKMIATKYNNDYKLFIYAQNENKEEIYIIDIMALLSNGSAQINFNGQTFYILTEGINHVLGVLDNVRIGVK